MKTDTMKKRVFAAAAIIVILLVLGILSMRFRNDHTFTMTDSEAEQIQPVLNTVRVWGTQDTDVLFIDSDNPENRFQIGYITPGMSETIKLERGKWYKVEAGGEITLRMVNIRAE